MHYELCITNSVSIYGFFVDFSGKNFENNVDKMRTMCYNLHINRKWLGKCVTIWAKTEQSQSKDEKKQN